MLSFQFLFGLPFEEVQYNFNGSLFIAVYQEMKTSIYNQIKAVKFYQTELAGICFCLKNVQMNHKTKTA